MPNLHNYYTLTLWSLSLNVRAGNSMDSFTFAFNGGLITLSSLTIDEIQPRIGFGGGKQVDAIFMIRQGGSGCLVRNGGSHRRSACKIHSKGVCMYSAENK
jgi:hypothetical protein